MIDFIYYVGGHGALNLFDMIPIFLYMIFAGQQCKPEFIPHLRPVHFFYRFTSNLYRETFLWTGLYLLKKNHVKRGLDLKSDNLQYRPIPSTTFFRVGVFRIGV